MIPQFPTRICHRLSLYRPGESWVRFKLLLAALICCSVLGLSACGQKGPLTLPDNSRESGEQGESGDGSENSQAQ